MSVTTKSVAFGGSIPRIGLDDLSTAIIRLSDAGAIEDINTSAARLFGFSEAASTSLTALLDYAERSGRVAAGTRTSLLASVRGGGQVQITTTDGRQIACTASALPGGGLALECSDVSGVMQAREAHDHDGLTGLPSRAALLNQLAETISPAGQGEGVPAVLHIDLDRFKTINDTLGHAVGDAVLKLASERIRSMLGPEDMLVRVGGDEFVLLHAAPQQPFGAEGLARRLIDLLGRAYLVRGNMINLSASIGLAIACPESHRGDAAHAAEALLKRADVALFQAKSAGKGQFKLFESAMEAELELRRALEIDLRRAVALKQLSLAYQPQVLAESRELVGFEALLRWTHPEKGPISPGLFIPLAEEIGLIGVIGDWVLRTACRDAALWPENIGIAVNLSPLQFGNPKLVETVVSALAASGLNPRRLELEITEGTLLVDTAGATRMLTEIKALGVQVAMDDFGTGYASLGYLQKFPFDKLKIDQSFVRRMVEDKGSDAIVRAVVALGTSLGMKTLAEGVETEEQFTRIRDTGCQQVQGYLTGRPVPVAAATALSQSISQASEISR